MTTGASALSPVTTQSVRELLSESRIFPRLPAELDDDDEFALDSLGLVWLLHEVEQRYGLVVEPTDEDIARFTSIRRIAEYLCQAAGAAGGSDGR